MSKEAMKLALEALEWNMDYLPSHGHGTSMASKAITALREALAEQPRLLSSAPCDQCGYNGPGYYQPKTHPCASKHHKALAEQPAIKQDLTTEQPAPGSAHYEDGDVFERIGAMKKQPAQQEPVTIGEPVGWHSKQYGFVYMALQPHQFEVGSTLCLKNGTPAWRIESSCCMTALISMSSLPHGTVFYTSPPAQRKPWVGLTDDEILYCVELENPKAIAEEVEAKLKEKNT